MDRLRPGVSRLRSGRLFRADEYGPHFRQLQHLRDVHSDLFIPNATLSVTGKSFFILYKTDGLLSYYILTSPFTESVVRDRSLSSLVASIRLPWSHPRPHVELARAFSTLYREFGKGFFEVTVTINAILSSRARPTYYM